MSRDSNARFAANSLPPSRAFAMRNGPCVEQHAERREHVEFSGARVNKLCAVLCGVARYSSVTNEDGEPFARRKSLKTLVAGVGLEPPTLEL